MPLLLHFGCGLGWLLVLQCSSWPFQAQVSVGAVSLAGAGFHCFGKFPSILGQGLWLVSFGRYFIYLGRRGCGFFFFLFCNCL